MTDQGVNLVFLDVDGVLNTTEDHRKMNNKYYYVREELVKQLALIIQQTDARVVLSSTWRFSPDMVEYIKGEIAKGLQKLNYSNNGRVPPGETATLESYDDIMISVTPDLSQPSYDPPPLPENSHRTRTDEILLWLKENAEIEMETLVRKNTLEVSRKHAERGDISSERWILDGRKIKVKNFVCLDDMNLEYYSCYRLKSKIKEHVVVTRTSSGLLGKHVKEAVKKLGESFDINEWANSCFVSCDRQNCFHKKQQAEVDFLESIKRSSLNTALEIKVPERSRTYPGAMLSVRAAERPTGNKVERAESGYDCLL